MKPSIIPAAPGFRVIVVDCGLIDPEHDIDDKTGKTGDGTPTILSEGVVIAWAVDPSGKERPVPIAAHGQPAPEDGQFVICIDPEGRATVGFETFASLDAALKSVQRSFLWLRNDFLDRKRRAAEVVTLTIAGQESCP